MDASTHRQNESIERPRDNSIRTQILPVAVEAVVYMGYPSDLVLSTYHQLLSTHATKSHDANHPGPRSRATDATRNIPSHDVSAATLLAAVEDAIRHSGGVSSATRRSSGLAESSLDFGALQGPRQDGEGMGPEIEDVQLDESEDEVPSTSQPSSGHAGQQQSTTAVDSTDSQTSISASQSSINDQSSTEEVSTERRRQLQARVQALRAENRRLKARQTCVHCRQKPVGLTFLPCGHFIVCEECGPSFEACPKCRKTIMADVKTFL